VRAVEYVSSRLSASHRAIVSNASSLVGTTVITSGLGFVYWWVAARAYSADAVGFASATISSMTLIATLSMLGFGTLLMGELPRHRGQAADLLASALALTGAVAALLGACFAVVAPLAVPALSPLSRSTGSVALYAAGVSLTATTMVLDQALIGLLRGSLQLWRNGLFAGAKLLAICLLGWVFAVRSGLSIYATWALGNVASLFVFATLAPRASAALRARRPRWHMIRDLGRGALSHHALNLSLQGPTLALPLIVTAELSLHANASFYVAWMVAGIVLMGPLALSIVLYAAGAAEPEALEKKIRLTTSLALVIGIASNIFLFIAGGYILRIFGRGYAADGRVSLSLLGLAVFPAIVKDHYVALSRIHGAVLRAALMTLAGGLLEVAAAAIGAHIGGLPGLCLGWNAALVCEAACMAGTVYSGLHPVRAVSTAPERLPRLEHAGD
jgi:O-antigen/teichoic acid export membrane protein